MKQKIIVFIIGLILIFFLLAWCPWVNENFVERRINSNSNTEYKVYFFEKIPFGARSVLYWTRTGKVDGILEKAYSLEYTSFIGTRKVIYDEDLEKIKPKTTLILEPKIINKIKEKFPEVKDIKYSEIDTGTDLRHVVGGSQDIHGELIDGNYIIIFWQGYGDCTAGCEGNHWWYFEVKSSEEINKIGETGTPIK